MSANPDVGMWLLLLWSVSRWVLLLFVSFEDKIVGFTDRINWYSSKDVNGKNTSLHQLRI